MRTLLLILFVLKAFCSDLGQYGLSGSITSSNYAVKYSSNTKQRWIIVAPEDTLIRLHFQDPFQIESGHYGNCYDYLNLIEGQYRTRLGSTCTPSVPIERSLCGLSVPNDFVSASNTLIVEFCTDDSTEEIGFSLRWTALSRNTPKQSICGQSSSQYPNDIFYNPNGSVAGRMSTRIVGGFHAPPHSWPWAAAIYIHSSKGWKQFCGGALIENQWVVTAAHCFKYRGSLSLYRVKLGADDKGPLGSVDANEVTQQVCGFSAIHVHPKYISFTQTHDVALVKLDCSVVFNDAIKPVCMADETDKWDAGENVVIAGWGNVVYQGQASRVLLETLVTVVNWHLCYSDYETSIDESMFCAATVGRDACQGDSGGPIVARRDDIWILAGTISWGNGCANPSFPGIYGNMAVFRSWIDSVIYPAYLF